MGKEGTSSTVTPRLRFPEFRKAAGWTLEPLSKAIHLVSGMHLSPEQYDTSGEIPYFTGPSDFTNDIHTVEKWTDESTAIGNRDDTLITVKGNGVGDVWYLTLDSVAMGRQLMAVRTKKGSSHFIHQFLLTKRGRFEDLGSGNLIPGLSRGDVLDLVTPFPSEAEQQKIADCLTSLDEVIAAQGRKVAALADHKRGLMQQLFPREDETLPRLRFPEFRADPEWKIHAFDEFVAKSFYGTSSSTSEKGRYPVLRMGNMVGGGLDTTKLVFLDLNEDDFESFRLHIGDILLNRTNSPDLVGKISIFQLAGDWICASYIVAYRMDKKRLDPVFCNAMLNTQMYQAKIKALSRPSVSQANINPTMFRKELTITVPSIVEQQRIADCLSALDAQIAAESEKLDALKTHKKALMQQLFPSAERGN